jgi:hypothetical protein
MSAIRRIRAQRHVLAQEEESFWPGYVDALVNVVLNLLFLLAILTLAAFVLGHQAGKTERTDDTPQQAQVAPTTNPNTEARRTTTRPPLLGMTPLPINPPRGNLPGLAYGNTQRLEGPEGSTDFVLENANTNSQQPQTLWRAPVEITVGSSLPSPPLTEVDRNKLRVREVRNLPGGRLVVVGTPSNAWLMSQAMSEGFQQSLRESLSVPGKTVMVWTNTDNDPQRRRQDYMRTIQMREWLIQLGVSPDQISTRLASGGSVQNEVAPLFIWVTKE